MARQDKASGILCTGCGQNALFGQTMATLILMLGEFWLSWANWAGRRGNTALPAIPIRGSYLSPPPPTPHRPSGHDLMLKAVLSNKHMQIAKPKNSATSSFSPAAPLAVPPISFPHNRSLLTVYRDRNGSGGTSVLRTDVTLMSGCHGATVAAWSHDLPVWPHSNLLSRYKLPRFFIYQFSCW